MHPLAAELNKTIDDNAPAVGKMLTPLGRELFFPKGILAQGAEAKAKAKKYDATIGIAVENNKAMHLPCIQKHLGALSPNDTYTYAPAGGRADLREAWRKKMAEENPRLRDKEFSLPIVTSAITHGLALAADLFVGEGDTLLLPDKYWENYRLTFSVRQKAVIETYPTFNAKDGFNVAGLEAAVKRLESAKGKLVILLNFPNNPTGYSITALEADGITAVLKASAGRGTHLVVIHDDAYFGLFFEPEVLRESLFGFTANLHEKILAVKLCGATKEEFVWGFRVGFITFGTGAKGRPAVYAALEKKVTGAIRSYVSNGPHLSQTLVLKALQDADFRKDQAGKFEILGRRARRVKEVLAHPRFQSAWSYYPFNSGYFMCLKMKGVDAEKLRVHLLDKYGVGTIAEGDTDLRVAFSCIEEGDIEELFDLIRQGAGDLKGQPVEAAGALS